MKSLAMLRPTGLLLLAALACSPAHALESDPHTTPRDTASLVSASDFYRPGAALRLGLYLKLAPGWHTYWSNPGDAGAPPTIEITGATITGVKAGPIAYPTPRVLHDGPFTSYAYTGKVLLPVSVTVPAEAQGTLTLTARASWLVCASVCVPEQAVFSLNLPPGSGAPGAQAALFATADATIPRPSPFTSHIAPDGTLWLAAPHLSLRSALFFPADSGVIDQGAPQGLRVTPDYMALTLKPVHAPLTSLSGVLSLTDTGGQVSDLTIDATPAPLPASGSGETPASGGGEIIRVGLVRALLLAFAGGLILNLMPCVLPVLAMKALALAQLSGAARGHVRREAALYTLGVLVAFCALGGLTLAARAAGDAVGWGAQFQSAIFSTLMAWLLLVIGLNMSGVFLLGGQLAGAGQSLAARGSFFTGLLAVVVATPCTAPFMGVALAAALSMPAAAGMLIFLALGLGLAAPYAALALSPGVAALLPRPGAWMDTLKHLLAFPMYGAALWMLWVVSQQTDPIALAAVLASLLLIAFAAWAYGTGQMQDRPRRWTGAALIALLLAGGLVASLADAAGPAARGLVASDGSESFSPGRLASLRAEHRPVFVDMSAAWCVTCLVNERIALAPAATRAAFAAHHVAYLKGDWTRRDPEITAFLKQFDRDGVPLYVWYPAEGMPRVLPQILTEGMVVGLVK